VHYFLPFVVVGLTAGSVYGLAGTGLVLTYKTSGIFNFAHGSVAAVAAFVFYWLVDEHGWPWELGAVVSVLVLGPVLGLLLELMARLLDGAGHVLKIAATVGLVVGVLAIGDIWYGNTAASFPHYLPTSAIDVLGAYVTWEQIIIVLISLAGSAALYVFFRVSRLGTAMRAVVDDGQLLSMTGQSAVAVRRWSWIIGATFAGLSGILLAPSLSLDGLVLTELVVQAFGAAAIGWFSSLPWTYAGGLLLGVAGAIATKYVADVPSLAGLPLGLPFIILFAALIATPRARLAARRFVPQVQLSKPYVAPARMRVVAGVIAVGVLIGVPGWVGAYLPVYAAALADAILFLSLGLLVKTSGQVSLCQYAFAAVGAAAMGHLAGAGMPWLAALLVAGLIAVPIGALIAIPAIRLSGVFLALATLGFGILLEQMFYTMGFMFGSTSSGLEVPEPDITVFGLDLSSEQGMYYVVLVFAVLAALATVLITRSRLGRLLSALSDSPVALETLGTAANVSRVVVFCLSAFLAAISGALTASLLNFVTGAEFESFNSLILVALVVIIPAGAPWYALIAAAGLDIVPAYLHVTHISDYLQILFGVSAVLAPFTLARQVGLPARLRELIDEADLALSRARLTWRRSPAGSTAPAVPALAARPEAAPRPAVPVPPGRREGALRGEVARPGSGGLAVRDLTVAYGGAVAVSGLTLTAPAGRVTGLIGPNGAGKTTTFNAICGLLRPGSGAVTLHGRDISRLGPSARARLGLGRTFQRAELFGSLTAGENISLGRESTLAGANPVTQVLSRRGDHRAIRRARDEAVEMTGIGPLLDLPVDELSTGQRRLVELARVLAGPFDLILLDEPSSGLDREETAAFGAVLRDAVAARGIGMLIVEHDMALVQQACDRVWVLDFGRLIFNGTPQEMLRDGAVRAAYLGADPVAREG
jgi:ABC-type branched-subunit amino acid transport system ATPase component/branched-subunit amino acid ABC-type transport system permease component